ncbi:hypothetical protein GMORB2_1433 [Geosmithia morbida]|uniref:Uncharacterized protein n=1 Tax=Geosmithia morbida TaxID=1094350 RepID=A0A9P4Z2F2_9HYPO|nr:uncharacterized protein GMORB2_1433 [Geosmithia morbida]KAF4126187.1 hypothetical protein GMORB2_1433 [Geosmithia morbida]
MMMLRYLAFSGVMASGIVARDPMCHFVYTVNICTIVRETACLTGLSVGGVVPDDYTVTRTRSPSSTKTDDDESATATATSTEDPDEVTSTAAQPSSTDDNDNAAAGFFVARNAYLYGVAGVAGAVLV